MFRRYADEQVSALLQGLVGLPSALTSPTSNGRWDLLDERRRWRREAELRRVGFTSSSQPEGERTVEETQAGGEAAAVPVKTYTESSDSLKKQQESERWPGAQLKDDYPIHSHPFPNSFCVPFHQLTLADDPAFPRGLFLADLADGVPPAWPLRYLITSPYSPLRLEQHEPFRDYGARWRNAFEDLIALERGQDLPERSSENTADGDRGVGEWVAALLTQSSMDGWKRIEDGAASHSQHHATAMEVDSRQPENDAMEETETELDLYERFLAPPRKSTTANAHSGSGTREHPSPPQHPPGGKSPEAADDLSIISALTTTERRIMPDGSVHTKVVLKKKFADGREESSETFHTTQGHIQQAAETPTSLTGRDDDANVANKEGWQSKTKGWFWSG